METLETTSLHRAKVTNDGYVNDAKADQIGQCMVEQIKRRQQDLAEIYVALLRMQDGFSSFDERTSQPIQIEPLQALPTVRTAI